jgi:hypothetical protein
MQQISVFIEAVDKRMRLWVELGYALSDNQADRVQALTLSVGDPEWTTLCVRYRSIPHDGFQHAFEKIIMSEVPHKPGYTRDEVRDVLIPLRRALIEMNDAVEHFVFSPVADATSKKLA